MRHRVAANSVIIKRASRSGKVIFPNLDKTECLKLTFTCRPRCSGLSPEIQGSLGILALAALLRLVSPHALALSLALSTDGVLGGVLPSCPAEFVVSSLVLPPLQARPLRLLLWWCFPCAPSTGGTLHTGAPSQGSRPVSRPVVPYVPAFFLALSTGSMISLLPGR